MPDLIGRRADDFDILPARKLSGTVSGVFHAPKRDFVTEIVERIELDFEGIVGDYHYGNTRLSGGREPWYPRRTEMRNERHLSIVASDELAAIAAGMAIERIAAEWVGANLAIDGVPHLSMLPAGTLMFFKNGVTLKVDGQNVPCRLAGRSVATHAGMEDVKAGEMLFPKIGRRLRGLVAWVEKPGAIEVGETVSVRIPEQWVYR